MSSQNLILKTAFKAVIFGCLFCVFFTVNLFGQSEKDVVIADPTKKEKAYHPSTSENEKRTNQETFSGYSAKKDQDLLRESNKYKDHSEKSDWKKEEVSEEVSTLSFNIFLYVLDRFKED
ncbi:hypothetical protein [Cyclobacterium plantarum]|uniref:Uncharacterized protein n=1 Tax=Cyclobacterium plantarum TaxID=2716263 RepID=A0ABX0HC51_9BACT|nr:hypothetical protein [Cyclobacterium plantarum]NHE59474.1 hypothetical protein [Cyclobacterium plantarum]